ncbi:MAG: TetR/AcrR family transcriptional regulator [Actinobacteria bacterium]|jgi:AcrR family transcriptional regulator|nr:MAG: TetR/AcrR family transcriptional regulator [Actinomycetota bacterium]
MNQAEKSIAARDEISSAAMRLFARKGFKGTTIRDISRESGRSMGCIYHHFSGKEEIFATLIMRLEILPGLEKVAFLLFAPGFPENLQDIAFEIAHTIADQKDRVKLWYVDALEFDGKYARQVIQAAWPAMDIAIKAAFANKGLLSVSEGLEPGMAMRIIISSFMGIFMQQEILGVYFTDDNTNNQLIKQASKLFLHGLLTG